MLNIDKSKYLLLYFIISISFMEMLLRIITPGKLISLGFTISLVISISFAIIIYLFCSLFQEKINYRGI